MKFKKLVKRIHELHNQGAYHVKRGFSLKDSNPLVASNHLIEEMSELQAEIIMGEIKDCVGYSYNKTIEEAADVLLVYIHLLKISGLNFQAVLDNAGEKLERNFTLDRTKIKTSTPGFNRSNRVNE